MLRVVERTNRIAHIAEPLYSWGEAPTSTVADPEIKPYAHEAGRRALQDSLARRGEEGEVLDGLGWPYRYRVKRAIRGTPLVSLVIPDPQQLEAARPLPARPGRAHDRTARSRCWWSTTTATSPRRCATWRPSAARFGSIGARVVPYPHPFHFARMNNVAAREARGEFLLLLNDDTEAIEPEWLSRDAGARAAGAGRRRGRATAVPERQAAARRGDRRHPGQGRPCLLGLSPRPPGLLRLRPRGAQLQRRHGRLPDDAQGGLRRGGRLRRGVRDRLQRHRPLPAPARARLPGRLHAVRAPLSPPVGEPRAPTTRRRTASRRRCCASAGAP